VSSSFSRYVIPPSASKRFEKFAASRLPSLARRCPAFLRHKMTIIAPSILGKQSIPFGKMTQYENEFIITFPYAYHSGFNYGFNCAESTNFALERWIEYGKHSVQCACRHDMVKIGMDRFVLKYQPELYDDWCRGLNLTTHPEDKQTLTIPTIVRSSPTKRRLPVNNNSTKSKKRNFSN
jgi:jumonji domain-containing protein 2